MSKKLHALARNGQGPLCGRLLSPHRGGKQAGQRNNVHSRPDRTNYLPTLPADRGCNSAARQRARDPQKWKWKNFSIKMKGKNNDTGKTAREYRANYRPDI